MYFICRDYHFIITLQFISFKIKFFYFEQKKTRLKKKTRPSKLSQTK